MYSNLMQVVTVEGNGITKFDDLKGKRVSTGSPGSGTEIFAFRLIEAAGLDKDKDMSRERLSAAKSATPSRTRRSTPSCSSPACRPRPSPTWPPRPA